MVTMPVSSLALTRSPTLTLSTPVRPVTGAVMVQYSRLSRAVSTAAWSAATAARSEAASAMIWSYCSLVT